jgi:putative transposase
VIEGQLAAGGPEGEAWRKRQLALMSDVSAFMKLLKQRFAIWFNKAHQRYGTLFAERFKSVLVESQTNALRTMALYIDLNPVRAGLVADPKDYHFCGYGEAVAGHQPARTGLCRLHGGDWRNAHAAHRTGLFGTGSAPRERGALIAPASFEKVLRQKGQLPLADVLRCRVRFFTDAAVLGSQVFVATHLAEYRKRNGTRKRTAPRPLPPIADWGGLTALRALRLQPFG